MDVGAVRERSRRWLASLDRRKVVGARVNDMHYARRHVEQLLSALEASEERERQTRKDVLEICHKMYAISDALFERRPVNLIAFSDELDRLIAKYGAACSAERDES